MNHQKHTELTNTIEQLKKEIETEQEVRDECNRKIEDLEEELDKAEIELINLEDEEPTDEEYAEHQQQEYDTRIDLENEQL